MTTALLLLPDLTLILVGCALRHLSGPRRPLGTSFGPDVWTAIERLVYFVLFPALLFSAILRSPLDVGSTLPMLLLALSSVSVAMAAVWIAGKVLKPDQRDFASIQQCAFRFNTYIGLALAQRLGGDACVAQFALIVTFAVPLCNGAAVLALAAHNGSGLLHQLLRNPLLVATLAGLAGNLMGLTLPEPLQAVLVRMGQASVALGLMAVGAGLNLHGASDSRLLLAIVTLIKVMLLPACALWVGQAMGLPREVLQTVMLFSALPTASSAYILTVQMGGNGPLVARAVTVSTLVSILSLPMWLSWVP